MPPANVGRASCPTKATAGSAFLTVAPFAHRAGWSAPRASPIRGPTLFSPWRDERSEATG